jgi:hypothetical protein
MASRRRNERVFGQWEELANGGRRYWLDVRGQQDWTARYVKEVDAREKTVRFFQEIRDATGRLVEVHEKYPKDTGHKRVREQKP